MTEPTKDEAAFEAIYTKLPDEVREDQDDGLSEDEPEAEAEAAEEGGEPEGDDEDYERAYIAAKSLVTKNILEKLSRDEVLALAEKAEKQNAAFAKLKAENGRLKTDLKGKSQTREDPDGTGEPGESGRPVAVELTDEIQSFAKALTEHLGDEGLGKAVSAPLESLQAKVNLAVQSVAQAQSQREAGFTQLARLLVSDSMRQRLGDRLSELGVDDEEWEAIDKKARRFLEAAPDEYAKGGDLTIAGIREAYEDALFASVKDRAVVSARSAKAKRTQTKTNGQARGGASRAVERVETAESKQKRVFLESLDRAGVRF